MKKSYIRVNIDNTKLDAAFTVFRTQKKIVISIRLYLYRLIQNLQGTNP